MSLVLVEVPDVLPDENPVAFQDQQVLGVFVLCGRGEVETAGDQHRTVDDHDLVVGDGVLGVDQDRDAGVGKEGGGGVPGGGVALVQDGLDLHAAFPGIKQRLGDRLRGEGVRLNQDLLPGAVDLRHHRLCGAAPW